MRKLTCNFLKRNDGWEQHTVETGAPQCLANGSFVDFGVFDCRPLDDPVGRHQRMHLGTYPTNFHSNVHHEQLREVTRPGA